MQMPVACFGCGNRFAAGQHLFGQRVACPACGAAIDIPFPTVAPPAQQIADQDEEPLASKPQKQIVATNDDSNLVLVGSLVGGGGFLIIMMVLIYANVGGNDTNVSSGSPAAVASGSGAESGSTADGDGSPGGENTVASPPRPRQSHPYDTSVFPTPNFPELGEYRRLSDRSQVQFVQLGPSNQGNTDPGSQMAFRVYMPTGDHDPQSLGCVIVAPAGTDLLRGNAMDNDDYHKETLPYVEAGYACIFYSLDGGIDDPNRVTLAEKLAAYQQFTRSGAGVINGRIAIDFIRARLPQVDSQRIYSAGHSSAGTHSLLLAAHEPRLAGAIAYAPPTDPRLFLASTLYRPTSSSYEDLRGFLKWSAPVEYIDNYSSPLFIFHARDDNVEPFANTEATVEKLKLANKLVKFVIAERGGHKEPMIEKGIPEAITWMNQLQKGEIVEEIRP